MSQAVAVNDYDRFSFAIFMAGLLHALIIFGVSFSLPEKESSATTLDVTLARTHSDHAPEEADFLAQANQEGSGTLEERAEITSPEIAEYASDQIRKTQQLEQKAASPDPKKAEFQAVTTTNARQKIESSQLEKQIEKREVERGNTKSLLERSLEIASLEAKYDKQHQSFTKRPRKRVLTATSTRASDDAFYMNQWLRKIESVGNLNYPSEAKRNNISGSLRLLVSVRADGTVHELKVLESSGHKVLDDAAKRIVRLAAPFAPFPENMRHKTDILEIIRTWQFKQTLFSTRS